MESGSSIEGVTAEMISAAEEAIAGGNAPLPANGGETPPDPIARIGIPLRRYMEEHKASVEEVANRLGKTPGFVERCLAHPMVRYHGYEE